MNTFVPKLGYCTDNAAMIAMSGWFLEKENIYSDLSATAAARLPIN